MTMTTNDTARDQALAQLESVRALVAALECDYDQLEYLRDERAMLADELAEAAECVKYHHDGELDENGTDPEHDEFRRCRDELAAWDEENAEELAELIEAAGDCADREEAEQRIHEDALSVEVRSDWHALGSECIHGTDNEPAEFRILLCTGGPHVEIRGELQDGEPTRAWLAYCGWGETMQDLCAPGAEDVLLSYAGAFYFGDC